jgi:hypothetical protein
VNLPDEILMSDEFSTIDGRAAVICRHPAARWRRPSLIYTDGGASFVTLETSPPLQLGCEERRSAPL